jgi:branched-chain amino acid transport system permease protein
MDFQMLLQIILNGILLGSIYSLISVGLALIFGVMKLINFAHGDFLMLGMFFYYWLNTLFHIPFFILLILAPIFLLLIGIFIYKVLIRRIINVPQVVQLLVTGGLMITLQNLAVMLWSSNYRSAPYSLGVIRIGVFCIPTLRLVASIISIFASALLFIIVNKTDLGRAIRATSENRTAAALVGVNTERIYTVTFGLGLALVGLAASLVAPLYWIYPTVGEYFGLMAFFTVILGGLGNIYGAFFGGLILGVAETLGSVLIGSEYQQFVPFCIFILILLAAPEGIASLRRQKIK